LRKAPVRLFLSLTKSIGIAHRCKTLRPHPQWGSKLRQSTYQLLQAMRAVGRADRDRDGAAAGVVNRILAAEVGSMPAGAVATQWPNREILITSRTGLTRRGEAHG
jgi:hypothetical protein